jgi:predicted secreted hydrolase
MKRIHRSALPILFVLSVALTACTTASISNVQNTSEVELLLDEQSKVPQFARATNVRQFEFPEDHGPHFEYQTEWWYYTGNLQTEDGRRFGYQFTIFRRGLAPGVPPDEGLSTNQIYFAHFALTDVSAERHYYDERFSRGASGLAGARSSPFSAWVEDWSVVSAAAGAEAVRITATVEGIELDLNLTAIKPIVKHGNQGLDPKSDKPGNASYYLSYTRMQTDGELLVEGQSFDVNGLSWFDHEWSTSVLGENAVGWDWFGLQLDDGRELMLYYVRLADGTIDPVSGGTYVDSDGRTINLSSSEVKIEALGTWVSEESGAEYPSGWEISLPTLDIEIIVEPVIDAQEMRVSFTYWEGAVLISGEQADAILSGSGYVELTGYLESMEGVLS